MCHFIKKGFEHMKRSVVLAFGFAFALVLLAGCRPDQQMSGPSEPPETETVLPTTAASDTPAPTPTPEPEPDETFTISVDPNDEIHIFETGSYPVFWGSLPYYLERVVQNTTEEELWAYYGLEPLDLSIAVPGLSRDYHPDAVRHYSADESGMLFDANSFAFEDAEQEDRYVVVIIGKRTHRKMWNDSFFPDLPGSVMNGTPMELICHDYSYPEDGFFGPDYYAQFDYCGLWFDIETSGITEDEFLTVLRYITSQPVLQNTVELA